METPDTRGPEETRGQLWGLAAALRGLARCLDAVAAGRGADALVREALLERARQDLLSTAWRLERRVAGLPTIPERGEPHPREEGWPAVRFAPDFDTAAAMRAELRAYGAVLGEMAGVLRGVLAASVRAGWAG